jgi:hypothetical protein
MRVEQEDAQFWAQFHGLVQDMRDAGRFAYASRTEHGEMLVQHFVDIDTGIHGRILLQAADTDGRGACFVENDTQFFVRKWQCRIADRGITRDAAAETDRSSRIYEFAHEVDTRNGAIIVGECALYADFGDNANELRFGGLDFQEPADCDHGAVGAGHRRIQETDSRLRAADRLYMAQDFGRSLRSRHRRRGCRNGIEHVGLPGFRGSL